MYRTSLRGRSTREKHIERSEIKKKTRKMISCGARETAKSRLTLATAVAVILLPAAATAGFDGLPEMTSISLKASRGRGH